MDKNEKMKLLKEKAAAFSSFLEEGIEYVKKYFPGQVQFVTENKEESYDEVMEEINKEMIATAKN